MNMVIHKNLANVIVCIRIFLVIVALCCLSVDSLPFKITGTAVLALSLFLDWVDGYIAQRFNICSNIGGLLDTLGDRITENLLFIFFAFKHILPVYVPLFFVVRSFLADFIRLLNYQEGISTFGINTSRWGHLFVASRPSRALYLAMKIMLIFASCLVLMSEGIHDERLLNISQSLKDVIPLLAAITVGFCLLRFVFLVYDSCSAIKKEFFQ